MKSGEGSTADKYKGKTYNCQISGVEIVGTTQICISGDFHWQRLLVVAIKRSLTDSHWTRFEAKGKLCFETG